MSSLKSFCILLIAAAALIGCDNTDAGPGPETTGSTGGADPTASGGLATASGGVPETGGSLNDSGGTATENGGVPTTGGSLDGGGGTATASGGVPMTGGVAATAQASDIPCDVQAVLSTSCWRCHGEKTDLGAPMSLVIKADFDAFGTLTTTEQVESLVKSRINHSTRPMPPVSAEPLSDAGKDTLNAWLSAGAPAGDGSQCDAPVPNTGGTAGGTGGDPGRWQEYDTSWPTGVAPKETCYQFLKHGGQTANDSTPHGAADGETYLNFFYKVPWTEPVVATRWRTLYDNTQILHHWLLYNSPVEESRDGNWEEGNGQHPGAQLLAVWAVGGGEEDFPPGVGLRLPAPGSMLEVEWHLYNTTGDTVADRSGVEICVVPESQVNPKYIAGVHWLGTEQLLIEPASEAIRGGICIPEFSAGEPATIVKWMPHMHLLGVRMQSWVLREDGSEEAVLDKPFSFDQQIMYAQKTPLTINQGDRIQTQCTYRNDRDDWVFYGESTDNEMCFNFVFAYPAGSLDSLPQATLVGASNTCLSNNVTHP